MKDRRGSHKIRKVRELRLSFKQAKEDYLLHFAVYWCPKLYEIYTHNFEKIKEPTKILKWLQYIGFSMKSKLVKWRNVWHVLTLVWMVSSEIVW